MRGAQVGTVADQRRAVPVAAAGVRCRQVAGRPGRHDCDARPKRVWPGTAPAARRPGSARRRRTPRAAVTWQTRWAYRPARSTLRDMTSWPHLEHQGSGPSGMSGSWMSWVVPSLNGPGHSRHVPCRISGVDLNSSHILTHAALWRSYSSSSMSCGSRPGM